MNLYIIVDAVSGAILRKCFCKDCDEAITLLRPRPDELLFTLTGNQSVPNSFLT